MFERKEELNSDMLGLAEWAALALTKSYNFRQLTQPLSAAVSHQHNECNNSIMP